jgi:hypothetical protein
VEINARVVNPKSLVERAKKVGTSAANLDDIDHIVSILYRYLAKYLQYVPVSERVEPRHDAVEVLVLVVLRNGQWIHFSCQ